MASFLYTANYTWHLYMDLKMKYNQNLNRMPSTVSRMIMHNSCWVLMYNWGGFKKYMYDSLSRQKDFEGPCAL